MASRIQQPANRVLEPLTRPGAPSPVQPEIAVEGVDHHLRRFHSQTEVVELSADGRLIAALSRFHDAVAAMNRELEQEEKTYSLSDRSVVEIEFNPDAPTGTYQIVVVRLAAPMSLKSRNFVHVDAPIGQGRVLFRRDDHEFAVTVTGGIRALVEAINTAEDNFGIHAEITSESDGRHVIFASRDTGRSAKFEVIVETDGSANSARLGLPSLSFSHGAFRMQQLQSADDAIVEVNHHRHTAETNVFSEVVPGVVLKARCVGETVLSITRNASQIPPYGDRLLGAFARFVGDAARIADEAPSSRARINELLKAVGMAVAFAARDDRNKAEFTRFVARVETVDVQRIPTEQFGRLLAQGFLPLIDQRSTAPLARLAAALADMLPVPAGTRAQLASRPSTQDGAALAGPQRPIDPRMLKLEAIIASLIQAE